MFLSDVAPGNEVAPRLHPGCTHVFCSKVAPEGQVAPRLHPLETRMVIEFVQPGATWCNLDN